MHIEPACLPVVELREEFGTIADEYHTATRNSSVTKRFFKAHELSYDPDMQQLASQGPLHLNDLPRVELPSPRTPIEMSLEDAITRRRSGRNFSTNAMDIEHLATLLYLANGVRHVEHAGAAVYHRNVPNAGNLGSVEIFPVVLNVDNVPPGIYHFDTLFHDLACLRGGQFDSWLKELVFFQVEFGSAAVALVLTSAVGRLQAKYGPRGYRLGVCDVGHVSQNLYLVGAGLGLEVCATAGFVDEELDQALGLDGVNTASMLVLLVGYSAVAWETEHLAHASGLGQERIISRGS
jgi:SagB-type dehydrogenase family enzyme